MANSIIFGSGSEGNFSATGSIGWNAAQGKIWGNTEADTFTFANDTWVSAFVGNGSWNLYGMGGADKISFEANSAGVSFNVGQLITTGSSSSTFAVIGGAGNDTFSWSGSTSPRIASFDGAGGAGDVLSIANATAGKQINLYDATYMNIEIVEGSSFADTLRGSTVANTLSGGAGNDQLWGGDGVSIADVLTGGAGADTFWFKANEGDDTISVETTATNSANDVVRLSGVNFADFSFSAANGNDAKISFKDSTGYSGSLLIDEWIAASTNTNRLNYFVADDKTFGLAIANDVATTLTGTTLSDYMLGGSGNDTLIAGAGDSLFGSDGYDILKYVATAAKFDGGANIDTLTATALTSAVEINLYDSTISNIEVLEGTSLGDILRGSTVANTLLGGGGADNIWGGEGSLNDSLLGGAGADTFWFYANQGNDVIGAEATPAYSASDVVRLSGVNFADLAFGYDAADANNAQITFKSSTGYDGALTIEEFIGAAATNGTSANSYRLNKFVTDDLTFGLAIANTANATLRGTSLADYMLGNAGNDVLYAGAGDSLFGGDNNDLLYYVATAAKFDGGANIDTLNASALTSAVDINLYDSAISNIEVLEGTSLGDVLRGSTLDNTLLGGKGADNIWGNQGADVLTGAEGADTYWFGLQDGVDTISDPTGTNAASDVVKFKELSFSRLSFARTDGAATESDLTITIDNDTANKIVLTGWGTAADTSTTARLNTFIVDDATFGLALGQASTSSTLRGSSLADYMYAGSGADSVGGSAGADTIFANGGDDTITYKSTAATVDGGDGTDYLNAASATAAVDIDLRNVDATRTNFANIEYVTGSSYDDILRGTTGAETLVGGAGADAIWGASGADALTGGAGIDSYWFGGGDGLDTITSAATNSADYVVFSSIDGRQIGGADLKTVELSGNDLVITLSTDDTLTLTDWNLGSGNKLNKFNFGDNGNYSLAFTDGVATWTKLS